MKRFWLFFFALLLLLCIGGCARETDPWNVPPALPGYGEPRNVPTSAASCFAIWRYENGDSLIRTDDGASYLITENDSAAPENVTVIPRRPQTVYMAASAVMCFWDAMDCLDEIRFSSLEADAWTVDGAREAMETGAILYAGKYREPDYELLLSGGCDLSIQSTMSEHVPKVKEKLEELGIPVFVDRSSYESSPLARCEWVRVYAEIAGCPERGDALFAEQKATFDSLRDAEPSGKTAVFFYVTASGSFVTRKSGDYISKMIELAGGENVFAFEGEDNALSSVTLSPEEFVLAAKDADIILYNGTISGILYTLDELEALNPLLSDFRAVKNGDVWCTEANLYQNIMKTGEILSDFHAIFADTGEPLTYLHKLDGGSS